MFVKNLKSEFFELCRDLICISDKDGILLDANPAWKTILGHEPSDVIGKHYEEFLHPDDLVASKEEYDEFKDGHYVQKKFRNRFRCHDGSYKWLEWNGDFIEGTTFAWARDCGDVKESEDRLNLALTAANVGIWDYNLLTNELIWDERMFALFDVDKKTASNDLQMWKNCVHPEDLELSVKDLEFAINEKLPFYSEFRCIHRDGKIRYLEGYALIYFDEFGKAIRLLGANTDITKRKELEMENLKQQNIVEHQGKLASLGELSAAIGHEINNPLNILLGYIDFFKDCIDESEIDKKVLSQAIMNQKDSALRIKNITDELRRFSRIDTDSIGMVNVYDVVKSTLNLIVPLLDKSGIKFDVQMPNQSLVVKGTESKINQILVNLLINAKDSIELSQVKVIHLFTEQKDNILTIFVKDSGQGIDERNQNKIFDPFFTSKQAGKGTGLGLSLSYSFASLLGGRLYLAETSPNGSCFGLELQVTDITN